MLAPQFIVAQICRSTSRITNTKALLLNLYNTGENRDDRDSLNSYSTHRLLNLEKRRTCDVNSVIFKNSVNLACLPIIADLYR